MNDYVVKGGDTLSGIAQKNNTTVSELAKVNNIANANYIQSGQTLKLPKIVSATPDAVNNNADFSTVSAPSTDFKGSLTPPQVPIPKVNTSFAQLAQDSIKNSSAPNPYEAERDQLISQMKSDLNLSENKGNDTVALNTDKGVYKNRQLVNDISSEILSLNAEGDAGKLMVDANMAGVTKNGMELIKGDIDRVNAIKSITLTARLKAAQGNVAEAEQEVKDAIDAKYSPVEARLKNYQTFLDLNKDKLERYDKKAFDNQQTLLNAKVKDLEETKVSEKNIQNLVVNAAKQGAPKDILTQAGNAKTEAEAAAILGPYAGDYFQYQDLKNKLNDFNKSNLSKNTALGGITKDVGFSIDDFKKGIASVESAGSTDAYGGKDQYKVINGQRTIQDIRNLSQSQKDNIAYGKYQVMGFNIPKWTKSALGRSLSIEEFLNDPSAQEAVFEQQSELNYAKYNNWDDVASVWFSGKPAKGNFNSDGNNTVPQYISKYRDGMGVGSSSTATSDYQKEYQKLDKFQKQNADQILDQFTKESNIWTNVNKADNAVKTADEILANPQNAAAQISLLYGFVAGLDPNSAVKEGEIALASSVSSNTQNLQNAITQVSKGQPIPPESAIALATETKRLAAQWASVGRQQENKLIIKARAQGVEPVIKGYLDDTKKLNSSEVSSTPTTGNQTWDSFLNSAGQVYGTNANSTVSLSSYSQGFTRN